MMYLITFAMVLGMLTFGFGVRCLVISKTFDDTTVGVLSLAVAGILITAAQYQLLILFLNIKVPI